MELSDLVAWILGGGFGGIGILSLIQLSPIKFDPLTRIARSIGRAINGEVIAKVDKLSTDVQSLRSECEEREANACRTRILRFSDEILHNVKHTKEHFDQVLIDIDTYEGYCGSHPNYKNNIACLAIDRIRATYQKCYEDGTFL